MKNLINWIKRAGFGKSMLIIALFLTSSFLIFKKIGGLVTGDNDFSNIEANIVSILLLSGMGTLLFLKTIEEKNQRVGINLVDLNESISLIKKELPIVNKMRILANATDRFLPAFLNSGIQVKSVEILLRRPYDSEIENKEYIDYLEKQIIPGWKKAEENKLIQKLDIKYFKFLSPDWQIIFDDKYLILGLNLPDKNIQAFQVVDSILFIGNANEELIVIKKYTDRFDNFFKDHGLSSKY